MTRLRAWRLFSAMMALVLVAALGTAMLPASPVQAATAPMVAGGEYHTVGLKADGTVVAVGYNGNGQCNVTGWTGITQVATGCDHTVGLKSDGNVIAVGYNLFGQCNVSSWTGMTQVAAGGWHTIGLKSDGTWVAVGNNSDGQCNVSLWTNIAQVDGGMFHTVGLKSDGTVLAAGANNYGQLGVGSWTGITQISAGNYFTVGLKSDGTVVAAGYNAAGQCNVTDWNLGVPIVPDVLGKYSIKGSIKFFDWKCNKWIVVKSGTLHITTQAGHKILGYFEPGVTIDGWPSPVPVEGYVGSFTRDDKGKVKNKPRLSLMAKLGTYCEYPDTKYVTYILNGAIKWDKKTDAVKSIKCTINGWGEISTAFDDASPSVGQFEGKFTATPAP